MKTFILLLAVFALATSFPLRLMETPVSDIPDCAADLQADFTHIESAIHNKDWSEVFALIKNISKSYADCKDGYNQVSTCIADVKTVASNVADIITAVKSKDMNPIHYITFVKSLMANTKKFTADCYVKKPTNPIEDIPQDLAQCGSDLKLEFQDLIDAFSKKDMSKIDDLFKNFTKTF
jgi:archaellum component FlaC